MWKTSFKTVNHQDTSTPSVGLSSPKRRFRTKWDFGTEVSAEVGLRDQENDVVINSLSVRTIDRSFQSAKPTWAN